jgi:hypothetical protein
MRVRRTLKLKKKYKGGAEKKDDAPDPVENPDGGDPVCPGGWKIDYTFSIYDKINPLFNCISSLKDSVSGIAGKVKNMLPPNIKVFGGSRRRHNRHRHRHRHRQRSHRV